MSWVNVYILLCVCVCVWTGLSVDVLVNFPNILVPPKITPFGFARDVNVGDRISIQCVVGTGDLPITFTWLKDDVPITISTSTLDDRNTGQHLSKLEMGSASTTGDQMTNIRQYDDFTSALSITSVTRSQGGTYTCRVQNDAAIIEHSALLRVNGNLHKSACGTRRARKFIVSPKF